MHHYLSACLCFQNAAADLAEWLAFYSVVGVEHFYLYNNDSTDGFAFVLEPYIASGRATLIDFPGRGIQQAVYEHCLAHFGERTRWLMFCDDDEFLFPVRDVSLPEALTAYEAYAGVAVSWMLYGSSGHWTRPRGLVIENYAMRSAVPDQHVKCIVDPRGVTHPVVVAHQFGCRPGRVIVDENGEPMNGPFRLWPTANVFRINHYLTKSRSEMLARRQRVQVNTGQLSPLAIEDWVRLEKTWNQVRDPVAARYADRVRQKAMTAGELPSSTTASAPRLR